MRRALVALVLGPLLSVTPGPAGAGGAASPAEGTAAPPSALAGVVPDIPTGTPPTHSSARAAGLAKLDYQGGPVMHSNRTHVIFWEPSGSGLQYEPGYIPVVERFLTRVAADSHRPTNVYSLTGQYYDAGGPAAYNSSYSGAVVATDPLPPNGCVLPPVGGPGWAVCLTDSQLQSEIEHVVAGGHLPSSNTDVYFLVTPKGLGSCRASGPQNCSLGGHANSGYCGYHRLADDGTVRYAVIPYNALPGHCESGNPRPNSSPADPALSSLSHEHNETITDPLANAWFDPSGNEDGDLCAASFGHARGGSGARAWNQVIHGGHYYLQQEYSNDDGGCASRDERDRISFKQPRRIAAHKRTRLKARAGDRDGSIVAYAWFFGDGRVAHGRSVWHVFKRKGVYRVLLRTTDSAGNWAYFARKVRVAR